MDTENKQQEEQKELLYSKKDFEELKARLEQELLEQKTQLKSEIEEQAKKASMTELERAHAELEEFKKKYQEKEDECLMAKQKEETSALLRDANLDPMVLELVYSPKNMEATRANIETLKAYIEKIKKENFQTQTPLPLTSKQTAIDPFIEGFDTNRL